MNEHHFGHAKIQSILEQVLAIEIFSSNGKTNIIWGINRHNCALLFGFTTQNPNPLITFIKNICLSNEEKYT